MRTAIIGYGKMGHEIEKTLISRGHTVELIIDQDNPGDLSAEKLAGIDVAIEFTTPATAYNNIRTCIEAGCAIVSGTTGWTQRLEELQNLCIQTGKSSMMYSSNYSLGVNLLFELNRRLAELMNRFEQYDVRMEEVHHTQKKDAPSGTAITLAQDIISSVSRKQEWVNSPEAAENQIAIKSIREGMVPGIHTIEWESEDDILELRHELKSRHALAFGAVLAAEFIAGKKGVFTINDMMR